MGLPQVQTKFSAQEYLAWESEQLNKHEYVAGEVFAMGGARQAHVIVTLNLGSALREHLRGTPCRPLIADMKLNVQAIDAYYYPDVMVTCHDADKVAELYIEHPKLIIEILSDSTALYDRGAKFAAYRKIESLEEYVLVDVDRKGVESFRRQADGRWLLRDFAEEDRCVFESVALTMTMARIFEDA
ncbi:MAG: Uma2 family endonuclease [Nitrosomonadales bacterium]